MRKGLILGALLALVCLPAAAGEDLFGEKLSLEDVTPVKEILTNPHDYEGKLVRVEGPVKSVCQGMGCWLRIDGGDGLSLLAKSTGDKVLVPTDSAGRVATVEGVVVVEHKRASEEGDEHGHVCASDKIRLETRGIALH
jgi:hypothetical protein